MSAVGEAKPEPEEGTSKVGKKMCAAKKSMKKSMKKSKPTKVKQTKAGTAKQTAAGEGHANAIFVFVCCNIQSTVEMCTYINICVHSVHTFAILKNMPAVWGDMPSPRNVQISQGGHPNAKPGESLQQTLKRLRKNANSAKYHAVYATEKHAGKSADSTPQIVAVALPY